MARMTADHCHCVSGPLSPTLTKPLPPADLTLDEQHILGYMPLRDDFERVCYNLLYARSVFCFTCDKDVSENLSDLYIKESYSFVKD